MVKNLPAMQEIQVSFPGLGRFPGAGNGTPFPVFLPGKSLGQMGLAGYSPWSCKESDMTEHIPFMAIPHFAYGFTK